MMRSYRENVRLVLLTAIMLALMMGPVPAVAQTARSKYFSAERAYQQLRNNSSKQKYRDQWLHCIKKFMAAYQHAPRGEWAAASLYQAATLYSELHKRSYLKADRQEALDLFDRVIRNYPASRYKKRAQTAKAALSENQKASRTAAPAQPSSAARNHLNQARRHYEVLQKNPSLQKYRDRWMRGIESYRKAFEADPDGPLADAALYGLGECYEGLYRKSYLKSDMEKAAAAYRDVTARFRGSPYAEKARAALGRNGYDSASASDHRNDPVQQVIAETGAPESPPVDIAQTTATRTPAIVEGLRYWSNPRYTRVVIDASQDTIFTYNELREDPSMGKPQRIYIDVHNSRLSRNLQRVVSINDNLLRDARAGQYSADTVRVVVDIKSYKTFKIFSLKNPYRIVLDVWSSEPQESTVALQAPVPDGASSPLPPSAIVKQLALGVRRIVIDPGHGGKDYGAPGYLKGVHEKKVVLQIGKRLADMIRKEIQCEVILTRSSDSYLSLEERTAIANTKEGDLFISIHTNASKDPRAYGIETYILNLATDDESIRVAARENATSTKNISDLDSILHDLMQHAKVSESTRLGSYVQNAMLSQLGKKYRQVNNKGVKQAPFYVLLGAEMPSILIETSFISNPRECKRLISSDYQEKLCRGIVQGIKRYIQETKPLARHPFTGWQEQG